MDGEERERETQTPSYLSVTKWSETLVWCTAFFLYLPACLRMVFDSFSHIYLILTCGALCHLVSSLLGSTLAILL